MIVAEYLPQVIGVRMAAEEEKTETVSETEVVSIE